MRVVVVGASGGIGSQVAYLLRVDQHEVLTHRDPDEDDIRHKTVDAVVCCNGSHGDVFADNYEVTRKWFTRKFPKLFVAMSGGGVGGPPAQDVNGTYAAAKAALVVWLEWMAVAHAEHQMFAVAPGLTATKMTGYKGADPRVPAAFIVKLLSGKYGHLSGSLLAAQRDDLDTMKPMRLRRVECP